MSLEQEKQQASDAYDAAYAAYEKSLGKLPPTTPREKLSTSQRVLFDEARKAEEKYDELVAKVNAEKGTTKTRESNRDEADLDKALEQSGITDPAEITDTAEIVEGQRAPTLTEEEFRNWLMAPRTPLELLDLIVQTSNNAMYRNIAAMIRPLLVRLLNSGVLVVPNRITTYDRGAEGTTEFFVSDNMVSAAINLRKPGYQVALHELIHLTFEPIVELGRTAFNLNQNNELANIYRDYVKLGNAIGKKLVPLYNEKSGITKAFINNSKIPGVERVLRNLRKTNIFKKKTVTVKAPKTSYKAKIKREVTIYDLPEIFTWAMTDNDAALVMDALPSVMGPPLFQKFVSLVRRVIGSPVTTQSALTDILDLGRRISEATVGEATIVKFDRKKFTSVFEARRTPRRRIPMPPKAPRTLEETVEDSAAGLRELLGKRRSFKQTFDYLRSNQFYNDAVRLLVNDRRVLEELQRGLEYASKLVYGFNDFYSQIINSSGRTWNVFSSRFMGDTEQLESLVRQFAEKENMLMADALGFLSTMLAAQHYKERRRTLFMIFAPLRNDVKEYTLTMDDGTTVDMSAAELRSAVLEQVRSNKDLTEQQIELYRDTLMELTEPGGPNNRLDPNGVSQADNPGEPRKTDIVKYSIDIDDEAYVPVPMDLAVVEQLVDYRRDNAGKVDEIIKLVDKIISTQKQTDRESHFWTQSVDNLTRLYDWKHYVPLKGKLNKKVKENPRNNAIDPRGKIVSPEFASDIPMGITGRSQDEQMNVILQVQRDAVKSSSRLGQVRSRMAIRNAIRQGVILDNKKKRLVVKPEDKYKGFDTASYQQNEWFAYNNPNGDLELYFLTDERQRNAIRQVYGADQLNRVLQTLSNVNAWVSKNFTRYNLRFAPKDFVRNTIFAAGIFGFEGGPKKVGQFIAAITARMANNGMVKGWKMWKLNEQGKLETEGLRLSLTDPAYKSAYEYLTAGGAVIYVQQFAGKGKITNAIESYTRDPARIAYDKVDNSLGLLLDCWVQAFEMNVRTVAYDMYKKDFLDKGLSEDIAQEAASSKAKILTNFEQVGEKAHTLRALYAFFGASGTGAARTLDALRPLLIKDAKTFLAELPDSIKNDPIALRNAEKKLKQDKKNARATMVLGMGVGLVLYSITRAMSGDDEFGRNLVGIDKKEQWVRALRIPLSAFGIQAEKGPDVVAIPWGFGWGAFLAWGAQLAAFMHGDQSFRDYLGNSLQVATDSFGVFPFARFNPFDESSKEGVGLRTAKWIVDSVTPSLFRPPMEYIMNLNGLGQELYSEARSSYGTAGATSESVPEFYNQLATWMEDKVGATFEPETYYFWIGNYGSAVGGMFSTVYGLAAWGAGEKDFSPSRDLPILGSFFGRRSTPDAASYIRVGNRVAKQNAKLKDLLARGKIDDYYAYLTEHPYAPAMINDYNRRNAIINKLQKQKNLVQLSRVYSASPKDRSAQVKFYVDQLNAMKYAAVESHNYWAELDEGEDKPGTIPSGALANPASRP